MQLAPDPRCKSTWLARAPNCTRNFFLMAYLCPGDVRPRVCGHLGEQRGHSDWPEVPGLSRLHGAKDHASQQHGSFLGEFLQCLPFSCKIFYFIVIHIASTSTTTIGLTLESLPSNQRAFETKVHGSKRKKNKSWNYEKDRGKLLRFLTLSMVPALLLLCAACAHVTASLIPPPLLFSTPQSYLFPLSKLFFIIIIILMISHTHIFTVTIQFDD